MAARSLFRAAARNDAILDLAFGEIFQRARRELLLSRRRAVTGEFVQDAGELCRHEHPEVLVRCVPGYIGWNENLHQLLLFMLSSSASRSATIAPTRSRYPETRARRKDSESIIPD